MSTLFSALQFTSYDNRPSWTLLLIFTPSFPCWFRKDATLPQHMHSQMSTQVAKIELFTKVSINDYEYTTIMSQLLGNTLSTY